jgi:hypothetical protein
MPVGPADLTAEISVGGSDADSVIDLIEAAGASEIAVDAGPGVAGLSGDRDSVLNALSNVVKAAVDSGARAIHIDVHIPEVTEL